MKTSLLYSFAIIALISTTASAADNWKVKLQKKLTLLGHRNWIVVADSAYPLQTAPGIDTIYVDADQIEVVNGVIAELVKTQHVKPMIYTDAEMKFVAEKNAPGISANREALAKILANQPAQVQPQEQIIGKFDEAGKIFKVPLIKTPLTEPYTSVFFQLECGFWNAESEKQLREAMKDAK